MKNPILTQMFPSNKGRGRQALFSHGGIYWCLCFHNFWEHLYDEHFQEGLGTFKDYEAKIEVDPGTTTHF